MVPFDQVLPVPALTTSLNIPDRILVQVNVGKLKAPKGLATFEHERCTIVIVYGAGENVFAIEQYVCFGTYKLTD